MKEKYGGAFFDMQSYTKTTKETFYKFLKEKNHSNIAEIQDFKEIWKYIDILYERNSVIELKKLSLVKLENLIKESFSLLQKLVASTIFVEALDENLIKELFEHIKGKKDFDRFFEIGSMVNFESFALRIDDLLLRSNDLENMYDVQYILCDYFIAPTLKETENKISELIFKQGGVEKIKEDKDKIIKEINKSRNKIEQFKQELSQNEKVLLEFMQSAMYIRDIRKEPLQKIMTIISNAMREYFERRNIPVEDIVYAGTYDFSSGIYKQDDYPEEIKRRENGVVLYINNNGGIFENDDIDMIRNKIYDLFIKNHKNEYHENQLEIKGNVGSKGTIEARVRVVLNEKDFEKFKKGEVLVTSMTRPEFVPLMKKASAIVTDEGGITCHAAIISRELKLSCITGTKFATQILNDGDLVEVDADNGVVRIIKKVK
ncbi:MAG TPA: hypothetical protein ENI76_10695 [Ignavibacteria bacterium]|nr:hypothetical protein [Ignavibacteria bacterium]